MLKIVQFKEIVAELEVTIKSHSHAMCTGVTLGLFRTSIVANYVLI